MAIGSALERTRAPAASTASRLPRASDAARSLAAESQHENEDTGTPVAASGIHAGAGPHLAELLGDSRDRGAVAGFVRDRTIPPFKVLPANDS